MASRLTILRPSRKLFLLGVTASVGLHALVTAVFLRPEEEAEEVEVARFEFDEEDTPFFIPRPRLAREFAFMKEVVPEGAPVVASRGDTRTTTVGGAPGGVRSSVGASAMWTRTGGSADFVVDVSTVGLGTAVVGLPQFEAVQIASMKEPEQRIDMEAEFLDLSALNTGRYKGMVIQDPTDRQNITGFVYLGLAWGTILEPSRQRAVIQLARWINQYTKIEAKVDDQMYLDSQDLFKAPFVYVTTQKAFELTEHEAENLAKYLRNGGFLVADNDNPRIEYGPAEASLRQMFKHALGRDARFEKIPNDHPLFHAFYDLNGPPPGGEVVGGSIEYGAGRRPSYWLEGIFLNDRLVAVYSDKGYGAFWEAETENEPHIKLGINLVVFALTQKGSIAQQQIDFYNQASGG